MRDAKGQTALVTAMREESLKVAEALLANPGIDLDAANAVSETPLMLAASRSMQAWRRRASGPCALTFPVACQVAAGSRLHNDGTDAEAGRREERWT